MSSLLRFQLVSQAKNPVSRSPKTGFVMTWPKKKVQTMKLHIILHLIIFKCITLHNSTLRHKEGFKWAISGGLLTKPINWNKIPSQQ